MLFGARRRMEDASKWFCAAAGGIGGLCDRFCVAAACAAGKHALGAVGFKIDGPLGLLEGALKPMPRAAVTVASALVLYCQSVQRHCARREQQQKNMRKLKKFLE